MARPYWRIMALDRPYSSLIEISQRKNVAQIVR